MCSSMSKPHPSSLVTESGIAIDSSIVSVTVYGFFCNLTRPIPQSEKNLLEVDAHLKFRFSYKFGIDNVLKARKSACIDCGTKWLN